MDASLFATYEGDYLVAIEAAQRNIKTIPSLFGTSKYEAIADCERNLDSAHTSIGQMDLEAPDLNPTDQASAMKKLKSYRAQLSTSRQDLQHAKVAFADEDHAKNSLLGTQDQESSITSHQSYDQRSRLLNQTAETQRQNDLLEGALATASHTETLSGHVLNTLGDQRRTMEHSRDNLRVANSNVDSTHNVLNTMHRRVMTNKLILAIIILVLLALIGVIVREMISSLFWYPLDENPEASLSAKDIFKSHLVPSKVTMTILLVSDTHNSFDLLESLVQWTAKHNYQFDYIFHMGDMANVSKEDLSNPTRLDSEFGNCSQTVNILQKICPLIVYVPGNHDPPILSLETPPHPRLTKSTFNLHNRTLRLARDLILIGFGGAVPGYQNGTMIWSAFPYTESQMSVHLGNLFKPLSLPNEFKSTSFNDKNSQSSPTPSSSDFPQESIPTTATTTEQDLKPQIQSSISQQLTQSDQCILLTHCGPQGSPTSISNIDPNNPIHAGSPSLLKTLKKHHKNIIYNIHGHVHYGHGHNSIGNTTVINPGSLVDGRFAILQLKRTKIGWKESFLKYFTLEK